MKKLISILLFMAIMPIVLPLTASADDDTAFTLILKKNINNPKDEQLPDDEGQRVPARPIACTISAAGGIQCTIAKDEIVAYELWDADGEACIESTADESTFVTTLFALPEDIYLLKIVTRDYQYIGELATY